MHVTQRIIDHSQGSKQCDRQKNNQKNNQTGREESHNLWL